MTFHARRASLNRLPYLRRVLNVCLALCHCRWWRPWRTSIVSPPRTTAPLPSTPWCFSAGRLIEGTGQPLNPCCPPWTGSSGTLPRSRRSQLGETAENTSEAAGGEQSVIFMDSHVSVFRRRSRRQELLSAAAQPHPDWPNGSGDRRRLAEGAEDGEIPGRVWPGAPGHIRQSQHAHHGVSTYAFFFFFNIPLVNVQDFKHQRPEECFTWNEVWSCKISRQCAGAFCIFWSSVVFPHACLSFRRANVYSFCMFYNQRKLKKKLLELHLSLCSILLVTLVNSTSPNVPLWRGNENKQLKLP